VRQAASVGNATCIFEAEKMSNELRRDPVTDPSVIVKLEGLIDRRMHRLLRQLP
jgi:hypothetical protein